MFILNRTRQSDALTRGMYCSIVIMLFLFGFGQPQPAPSFTAAWEPGGLRVVWSGAEAGSCLYLQGAFVDAVPCGASGDVLLPLRGGDQAYRPDPGEVLSLARDETRGAAAEVTVPRHEVILPVVVMSP